MNALVLRALIVIAVLPGVGLTPVHADEPIPTCRYDNSLIPIVKQAVEWAIADFGANDVKLPFERVVYNKPPSNDEKELSIHLIKDATSDTVNSQGCIVDRSFQIGGSLIKTDGDCIPTDRSKCTSIDDAYMQKRFLDIHGGFSDVQTGYEMTGACYMTNLQACLHSDRMDLLKVLGPRDKLSVKGTCVTNANTPKSISCSAGALKMLLSREAAKEHAPTVGILFVLSHELGHLSTKISSRYDSSDYILDLSSSREDKFAFLREKCRSGDALRGEEEKADNLALLVTRKRVKEISDRWPTQGTVPWLISQAGHFSTNLGRWNNDWHDGELPDMPELFRMQSNIKLTGNYLEYLEKDEIPSGYTPIEIRMRAKMFLCDLAQKKPGKLFVLMQSGTTHGTMVERLIRVISDLRHSVQKRGDSVSAGEDLVGRLQDLTVRRHRSYLRELEAEVCDLVDQNFKCPADFGAK